MGADIDDSEHQDLKDHDSESSKKADQSKAETPSKVIESEVKKISNEYVSGMLEKIGSEHNQQDKNLDLEPKNQNLAQSQIINESL